MQLTPYIIFNGNCEQALRFYAKALDGSIQGLSRYGDVPGAGMGADKEAVMHAQFAVDGTVLLMASDDGRQDAQTASTPDKVHLSLDFKDADQQQKVFDALGEEGTVTMPLQDTFWGARFGMLTDRFGVNWMVNHDKPKDR